jgi:hypothetical protein
MHALIVLTNALPDRDEEFNDWYTNRHAEDVLALDGFVAVQRFEESATPRPQNAPYRYLAIYEVADDKLDDAVAALAAARRRPDVMPVSDTLADDFKAWWYTAIGERTTSSG